MDILDDLPTILTFPFRDERWQSKLLVGMLFALGTPFIVPQWFALGYLHEISRTIIQGGELALPEWRNWGRLLRSGLRVFCAAVVFTLLPLLMIALPTLEINIFAWTNFMKNLGENLKITASLIGLLVIGLGVLLFIFAVALLGVAVTHMAKKDEFAALFRFKEWWPIFLDNLVLILPYLLLIMAFFWSTTVLALGLSFSWILIIAIPLILAFTYLYAALIGSALFALIYREGTLPVSQEG